MRRRGAGCGVVVWAAWLAVAAGVVRATSVVPWQAARGYDGEVVTVEGDVARARLEADTLVLEFSPDDPAALRIVLLIPLITDLPRQPQRLYDGKRIRATGKIYVWQGRAEMILRTPDAIEVVGMTTAAPGAPPPSSPPPPPPTRAAPPTTIAPAMPTPPPTAPAPPSTMPLPPTTATPPPLPITTTTAPPLPTTTTTFPPLPTTTLRPPPPPAAAPVDEQDEAPRWPARIDPCAAARDRWRRAAAAADSRAAELGRCLRGPGYRCRTEAAALAPTLSELEWAEQQVEAACP